MSKDLRKRFLTIAAVLLGCVFFAFPIENRINLGLDLQGGMHFILNVEKDEEMADKDMNGVIGVAIENLRNRLDGAGTSEILIQQQGSDQILVQVPGDGSRDDILARIKTVAKLEFKLVDNDPDRLKQALEGNVPQGYSLKEIKDEKNPESVLVADEVLLKGEHVADAMVTFDEMTNVQPKISLRFDGEGTNVFGKLTRDYVGRRLAIIIDERVLSAPNIREPILTGNAEISGSFTVPEATALADSLKHGALPVALRVEEERTIGPLLGQDSIDAGIQATIIGIILVLVFMVFYYRIGGLIASFALILNTFLILGIMGFLGWSTNSTMTLTLPGIAGIILTLGMAVDANVLIQERIREELNAGRALTGSVSAGFGKAFSAIIDSNLTTLIAAFMLFQFGSGPIKGFAVTLSIGLVASLFTALYVTRTFFMFLLEKGWLKKLTMMSFFKESSFDFVSKRYICLAASIILLVVGMVNFAFKGERAFGIDFVGGQIQEYRFDRPVEAQALREVLKEGNIEDAIIQQFDQYPDNVIVRTFGDTFDQVKAILNEKMTDNHYEVLRIEKVGPVVGKALRGAALLAILTAMGGILVFVGFRFHHFDFAAAGIIALLHDVIMTLGLIVMMGREVDLLVVTALLTIAGYSVNDTIIIFDRVRENLEGNSKLKFIDVINLSINQTLGRTILTTITTLLVVVTLFLKGGEVLNTFALCLLIGFVAGTYSTVFIASPIVLMFQKKEATK